MTVSGFGRGMRMTGQRIAAVGKDTYLSRSDVRSSAASRGARSGPGPRARRAASSRRRSGVPSAGSRRAGLLVWGLPVVGAGVDELLASGLGGAFALTAVIAGSVTAGMCSRAGAWWVLCTPPLVLMAVTVVTEQVAGVSARRVLTTSAVHWGIDAFPAMAGAELAVIAVLVVRMIRSQRSRRGSGA
ncbi:DUF6542 domain-containing protein [Streptomyces sp. NPDC055966]|uniref:DUF6542 domain-containing protein n=1 Tax=Streptomyces sp. NPDC055966 TaxID=3345669 RepID=UPI0035D90ECF